MAERGRLQATSALKTRQTSLQALVLVVLCTLFSAHCVPQTPSPLQEWQYIGAIPLKPVFENAAPTWEFVLGAGGEERPLYDGAHAYRFVGGPIFDVRYRDLVFYRPARDLASISFAACT